MDSPSDRPSKSMNMILALISRACRTEMHLVGTSDTSSAGQKQTIGAQSEVRLQIHRNRSEVGLAHHLVGVVPNLIETTARS